MSSLASLPEIVGFFSYSRRDDEHSEGALSRLRSRIHSELRLQLGRDLRLWQDTAAIPDGALWHDEIKRAAAESVFFVPIVTPSSVGSKHCRFEFDSFLKREAALGRSNLIFPLLYVRVPALEREDEWQRDEVLSVVGSRQYIDWQRLRHRSFADPEVAEKIEGYCRNIVESLRRPCEPAANRSTQNIQVSEKIQEDGGHQARAAPLVADQIRGKDPLQTIEHRRAETATRRKRSRPVLAAAAIAGVLLVGLAAYVYEAAPWRAQPAQPLAAASPAPAPFPNLDRTACADSLCGTVWTYTAVSLSPPSHDIHFLQNHIAVWTEPGTYQARTGYKSTYSVTGNAVYFQVNNKFSEYHGIIDGAHMNGTAENSNGLTWAWNAVKQ